MKATLAKKKGKAPAKRIIQENTFRVVAIGASAGGLEAVTQLLQNLPPDTGMTFIYVQHLSPDHKEEAIGLLDLAREGILGDILETDNPATRSQAVGASAPTPENSRSPGSYPGAS